MSKVILDASALLALIKDEPGAPIIDRLARPNCYVHSQLIGSSDYPPPI
ncbi:hypothetical protein [Candidatus Odyssella acanthamoebae]|nr:hypothetical protein [Candidatus Paracaedibacter acanthamoebae]